jgi:NAD(P)H dehydrogenase (quinone)
MHAHIVLAHPEPRSFNAHLAETARDTLQAKGWTVSVSDLYAQGFDPCERTEHYSAWEPGRRFDVQAAQRHASEANAVPAAVRAEIDNLDSADFLLLQYPMWWHLPPAMMKGWFDRVFVFGGVYSSRQRFENGRFVGKRAMLSVTVGTSRDTYEHNGRSGDIDLLLWPVMFSLAYVGYRVLRPFIAYGVEGGLRYSAEAVLAERFQKTTQDLGGHIADLDRIPEIPFNRMAQWSADGRITDDAPVFSPFIRRRKALDIE